MLWRRVNSRASRMVVPRGRERGCSTTWPWLRFTLATLSACASIGIARCTIPSPPSRAMVLAIRDPVTLSMLAETTGRSSAMRREKRPRKEAARREATIPICGRKRKSS